MNGMHDDDPRWLRLAATLSADPDPATLGRARARLATREAGPAWIVFLARPAAVVTAATLLVASVAAGSWMLVSATDIANAPLTSAMLADDGSYGLPAPPEPPAGVQP